MEKRLKLKREDHCVRCGSPLAPGTSAYWIPTDRVVVCVGCHGPDAKPTSVEATTDRTPGPAPIAATDPDVAAATRDVAGGSAQREYEKRSARERTAKTKHVEEDAAWRKAVKVERPVLGRIAAALTPKPQIGPASQPTRAWRAGAEGERRVDDALRGLVGIEVLHDRIRPGARAANIDHLAVGPAGVFVIDAKQYTGTVEVRDVGGIFRIDERLYVNRRDRTALVDAVLQQVDAVHSVLAVAYPDVAVTGVLCFVGSEWGVFARPRKLRAVTVLWPRALPDHVTRAAGSPIDVSAVATHLRRTLRPAS